MLTKCVTEVETENTSIQISTVQNDLVEIECLQLTVACSGIPSKAYDFLFDQLNECKKAREQEKGVSGCRKGSDHHSN